MHKLCLLSSLFLMSTFSSIAMANFPIRDGKIIINVSGSNGVYSGSDGSNAGKVNLTLSYTDATKKIVKLEGDINSTPFSQTTSFNEFSGISIYAIGGNGGSGSDGSNGLSGYRGSDGFSGSAGADGCPPQAGSDGSSGGNGTDGTSGSDGGRGGDGGNGGKIHITTKASESELLLLVGTSVRAGEGGSGGSGGRGGSGGPGGNGGSGGAGGRNTCNPAGSDASSGSAGSSGSSGSDGRDGSNGSSGSDGNKGSVVFTTTSEDRANNYAEVFKLDVSSIKSVDENEDSVLEPGEKLFLTKITVTNDSSMPSPVSQVINMQFKDSSTLVLKSGAPFVINEVIPAHSSKILTFEKGSVVFSAQSEGDILGENASLATHFSINSVGFNTYNDFGNPISWPVVLDSKTEKLDGYFGDDLQAKYSFKNISTKDIGPTAEKSMEVTLSWNSKTIPGADVSVTLANGQTVSLNQPYTISDFKLQAESGLDVPLKISVKNSKDQIVTDGVLQLSATLKDALSGKQAMVVLESTPLRLVKNIRAMAFDNLLDFKKADIKCTFSHKLIKRLHTVKLEVSKTANSDSVSYNLFRKILLITRNSPTVKGAAFDFAPYFGLFKQGTPDKKAVLELLNAPVAKALQKSSDDDWIMEPGSCR